MQRIAVLDELHVQNVALIREATLLPATGLTVITGETGAGKTALLSALALVAGGRADAGAVREGAPALHVEARFVHDEEIIVSRQVTADGRSRVTINGAMASVGQLAEGPGASLDLCGQHEHQRLMHVSNHREMLDAWAPDSIVAALESYADAFEKAQVAARAVEEVRAAGQLSTEAVDQARFVVQRIDEVAPEEGEYENIRTVLTRAENAEALMQQVSSAHAALAHEGGAVEAIGVAAAALEDAARTDESLAEAAQSLREASYIIEDVARDARSYRDKIDYDAGELARMQERMGQLQGLLRSWGPTLTEVLEAREKAQATIAAVDEFDTQLAQAEAAAAEAERILAERAKALHDLRTHVAPTFAKEVSAHMQRMELGGASLVCAVDMQERSQWTPTGPDHVEFLFKPASGMSARPLVRIASGGEMSRVMLAIKVVLGATDKVDTLVFDEVDAGVGGSAARALAEVLADLAHTHQVIVVTHLPQVAVLGETHYVVRKTPADIPETILENVQGEVRISEIARMLSGGTDDAARAHAAHMLQDAQRTNN